MRCFPIGIVLLLGFAPLLYADIEKPTASHVQGSIRWVYDYGEGQRLSQSSGKPMFVVFRCER